MIDEYLAFARGEAGEAPQTVDVSALLRRRGEDATRAGAEVEVTAPAGPDRRRCGPLAFKRALTNLAGNAAVHGEHVRLSAPRPCRRAGWRSPSTTTARAFPTTCTRRPSAPSAASTSRRNQNRKGVGLGLAIARDVARGHGGDITLERSDLGGLRAVIRLPG